MYELSYLDNDSLIQGFEALVAQDRRTTAGLLAHIAEIDARHLYLQAGFESMKAYCMKMLDLSEAAAASRLQIARLARELPVLFPAVASGRLGLTAVRTLASRLNAENVEAWIEKASGKTIEEIVVLLAEAYPQAESLRLDDGISPQVVVTQEPAPVSHVSRHVPARIEPIAPQRFTLQVTLAGETHDKLRRLQDLLGHALPNGDVAQVIDRAFDALIVQLEKRAGGARRGIHVKIRNAVYERDGGRCVRILDDGTRCDSRSRIEFDHIVPLAKGAKSTVDNLRLLCRAHNQAAAVEEFGLELVKRKKANRRRFAAR